MSMVIGTRLFGRPGEIYSPVSLARNDSQIAPTEAALSANDTPKRLCPLETLINMSLAIRTQATMPR